MSCSSTDHGANCGVPGCRCTAWFMEGRRSVDDDMQHIVEDLERALRYLIDVELGNRDDWNRRDRVVAAQGVRKYVERARDRARVCQTGRT